MRKDKWGTPEGQAYQSARTRCTNPSHISWKHYGGRGIQFLFTSFEQFLAELGPRPEGHELDRINNDGHYEPGNVRWATGTDQIQNRRPFKHKNPSHLKGTRKQRKTRGAYGNGYVFERHGAWFLQYYQSDGTRKAVKLAPVDREHSSANCRAIRLLRQKHMMGMTIAPRSTAKDMRVVDFWESVYLPYCEKEWKGTGMRPTTVRGFKQIWEQRLKDHFGNVTVQNYQAEAARRFLQSLKTKLGKNTLKHIRALASAMFSEAVERGIRADNPWHVKLPKDCKDPNDTQHYTREEAEDIITALVAHVDAQLVIALACFLGLGPAEIAGLQWGDVDAEWIHIRRNKPEHGEVGPPKTKERAASLPILDEVRVPLELWRTKSENAGDGDWIIPDLHNMVARVIRPHIEGKQFVRKGQPQRCVRCDKVPAASGVAWKALYSGRRGAITHAINISGNIALGQRLARHASSATTTAFYHKVMPDGQFMDGMKRLKK
ncbi:MAG TPA: site-specific integrase [Candidatus Sulfotelmatobacter sp.]|nr:site-specific integrase [Candidatus Sulfotelmatobacter sp.]